MKAIVVLGYRRPDYLDLCLSAIAKCRRLDQYKAVVSLDGGQLPREQMCSFVAHRHNLSVYHQYKNYGINQHNAAAYDLVFEDPRVDFLVAVEDDAILSADALELADWYYGLSERDEYQFLSLGVNTEVAEDPSEVVEFAGLGTSWAYCFTRQAWGRVRGQWNCKVAEPIGWDWSLTYWLYANGRRALAPKLSRVRNIGREGGVNAYPGWFDEHMARNVFSDGSFTGEYRRSSRLPDNWQNSPPSWALEEIGRAALIMENRK